MDVELTDEQQFLAEAVAGVVGRESSFARVRDWTQARDLAPADALAERQGWTGIGLDEDLGGQGGGVLELAVLAEGLGRGAVPWDRTLAGCLVAPLLAAAGSDEGRELAAASAEGEAAAVLCVDARVPLSPLTDARPQTVPYVLGAAGASTLILPVATDDEVALYAVQAREPVVRVASRPLVDRTRSLGDVAIGDGDARHLGSVSAERFATARAAAAVLIAADALGAAARMLELTVAYVGERRQFGVAVGSFQAVKHAAAEMLVEVEASRSAVYYAAWAIDAEATELPMHAAIAKSFVCSAAVHVADKALFLHGAIGYTWEHDLQFLFKRAKSDALVYGSPDAYRDAIADELPLVRGSAPVL